MAATGVSAASARRDAGRLAEAGLATRLHGGVQAIDGAFARASVEGKLKTSSFDDSRTLNIEAKRAIARRGVEIIAASGREARRARGRFEIRG
jgi:DeoR family ulaG and ulaABCDEF operon transcriptional repressor